MAIGQIWRFFLALTVIEFPAASIARHDPSYSAQFNHHLRSRSGRWHFYHPLAFRHSGLSLALEIFPDSDQSIPVLAYLMSVLLLVGISVFFAWFMPRFHLGLFRGVRHIEL